VNRSAGTAPRVSGLEDPKHLSAEPVAARPSPEQEARLFWRVRGRMVLTVLEQTLATGRLRLALVLALSAILWLALFWLFADGFRFLRSGIPDPVLHAWTVSTVFGMLFMALSIMLTFSSAIILYGSLFRGRDVPLLLAIPVRDERIFLAKYQETILVSSWGFLLLGSPMVLAYGLVAGAPWYFYAMLIPFLVAFTYIPAGVGAMACLAVVRYVPRSRLLALVLLGALVLAAAVALGWSFTVTPEHNLLTPDWFQEMLGRMKIVEVRLLPSWWLSSGLLEAAGGEPSDSVMFLALLISNALLFRQLAAFTATRLYRPAYSRLYGLRVSRRRTRPALIDRLLLRSAAILPRPIRLLIVKDFRLFRRDPVQWSQVLIFGGLLVLYFVNIRRFQYDQYYAAWVNMVSFLNVFVVGLLLSTFTTRFVFPMVSLEGRRFWVLGLLPVRRRTILTSKFLFAVGGSVLPCALLILLSDVMLRVPAMIVASHQLTCLILCFGLSGIAVGLGARLPNLRETSPSRIAAGFGGTLNLVLSTLFIVAVVLLTALPAHFYLGGPRQVLLPADQTRWGAWLDLWMWAGTAASVLLGIAATAIPLWVGIRAFRRMEF